MYSVRHSKVELNTGFASEKLLTIKRINRCHFFLKHSEIVQCSKGTLFIYLFERECVQEITASTRRERNRGRVRSRPPAEQGACVGLDPRTLGS